MSLGLLVWQSVYFVMPAYFANMAPVIVRKLGWMRSLGKPIDAGRKLGDGKGLFGGHKTWRGIIVAVIAGLLIALLQHLLSPFPFFAGSGVVRFPSGAAAAVFGAVMGLGAILGDLVKSFLKRRVGVAPGKPFIPFDQMDFIVGAYALTWPLYGVAGLFWQLFLSSLLVSVILHILTNHVAFALGIRKVRW